MRQAPRYLIIGNGRMATHMQQYFSLLDLPYVSWHRKNASHELQEKLCAATHVLLLISDGAITPFIEKHLENTKQQIVHFSGSLLLNQAISTHPLYTFSENLYDLATYQKIPFFIEEEGPAFGDLLPGLNNPHYQLPREQKTYYHALCVMANNFTTILWQKFFNDMDANFNVPSEALMPYLEQTLGNLKHDYTTALTGPLTRGDHGTLEKDLNALSNDPFRPIFKAFMQAGETTCPSSP